MSEQYCPRCQQWDHTESDHGLALEETDMTFEEWWKLSEELNVDETKSPSLIVQEVCRLCWHAAQEAMREKCAVSQCYHCQQGKPIDHIDGGREFHLDSKGCPTYCTGQDIRSLPVE